MSREFFDQRAQTWDENVAEKDESKLRGAVERMHLTKGAAVLDIGTGTGILLPYVMNVLGPRGSILALDFSRKMLEQARRKYGPEQVSFLLADVESIPIFAGSFDAVICYSSFPHFHDKPKALSEMRRALRTGGRLFICHTSSRTQINRRHRKMPPVMNDLIPPEKKMRRTMERVGFCEISIEDRDDSYLACATRSEF